MIRALIFDYYGVVRPDGFRMPAYRNDAALLQYMLDLRQQYKIGLLSNAESSARLSVLFEPYILHDYFDAVLASGDTDYAKPDAQMYRLMAERLGVQPAECLMIDDNPDYAAGVEAAGMQPVQYTGLGQLRADIARLTDTK